MRFECIDRFSETQVKELHRLYQAEWWTQGRKLSDVQRMLEESDVVVAFCERPSGKLVAFARILTDYVYRAYLQDVIVAVPYRGKGLARRVMHAVVNHPRLRSVETMELSCLPELVPLYRKWGFTEDLGGLRVMKRGRVTGTGSTALEA